MTDYAELRKELYEKFHDAYHKLYVSELQEENERLRAALEVFACDCEGKAICLGNCMHRNARAALEGK